MPLINPNLPENALINVRGEVALYFGDSNKIESNLTDSIIDDAVKRIHRKWHPSYKIIYADTSVPHGTGIVQLPSDHKKLFEVTSQTNDPDGKIHYKRGMDYLLQGFDAERRRVLQWINPDDTTDLDIRVHYYQKPIRAVQDGDIVDIEPDCIDLLKKAAELQYCIIKSNLREYDRLRSQFEKELQEWIDDDTDSDMREETRPYMADHTLVDYEEGEIAPS